MDLVMVSDDVHHPPFYNVCTYNIYIYHIRNIYFLSRPMHFFTMGAGPVGTRGYGYIVQLKALRAVPQFANTVWGMGGTGAPPGTFHPTVKPTTSSKGVILAVADGIEKKKLKSERRRGRRLAEVQTSAFTADPTLAGVPGTGEGGGTSQILNTPLSSLIPSLIFNSLSSPFNPLHPFLSPFNPLLIPSFIVILFIIFLGGGPAQCKCYGKGGDGLVVVTLENNKLTFSGSFSLNHPGAFESIVDPTNSPVISPIASTPPVGYNLLYLLLLLIIPIVVGIAVPLECQRQQQLKRKMHPDPCQQCPDPCQQCPDPCQECQQQSPCHQSCHQLSPPCHAKVTECQGPTSPTDDHHASCNSFILPRSQNYWDSPYNDNDGDENLFQQQQPPSQQQQQNRFVFFV